VPSFSSKRHFFEWQIKVSRHLNYLVKIQLGTVNCRWVFCRSGQMLWRQKLRSSDKDGTHVDEGKEDEDDGEEHKTVDVKLRDHPKDVNVTKTFFRRP
jgi:hypothetical protein